MQRSATKWLMVLSIAILSYAPNSYAGGGAGAPATTFSKSRDRLAGGAMRVSLEDVKVTCYDDGLACPGGCDDHVVMHPRMNGTANAHLPESKPDLWQKCQQGGLCEVCFSADPEDCVTTTYRGAGPPFGKFDFTPSLYAKVCVQDKIPKGLEDKCSSLNRRVKRFNKRINCISDPNHQECKRTMRRAVAKKQEDTTYYLECKRQGSLRFNDGYPSNMQRETDCMYERYGTGRNSNGLTWRKLLPAGCQDDSFVGRDGLDCCSAEVYSAACFPRECGIYYRYPPEDDDE